MTMKFMDLDVRPALAAGEEPFELIMGAVANLAAGQGLRLFAPFKPVPLLHLLGSKGFTHELKELEDGEWEVLFTPMNANIAPAATAISPVPAVNDWPKPTLTLDNRDLDPPEPMVRILAAVEKMREGEVLSALLCREPVFLLPELAKRGHQWQGAFEGDSRTYRILIRIGVSPEAAG